MSFFSQHKAQIFENAMSYVVVLAMLVYGIAKIVQFDGATATNLTVSEMTGMQLMWAFYGYSKPFALTIGILEVMGGILIFFRRTRIIGCLFVSTILINVILQDIFYGVNIGALRAAILYQILIVCVLYMNRYKVLKACKILIGLPSKSETNKTQFFIFLISGLLFVIFRVIEYYLTIKW